MIFDQVYSHSSDFYYALTSAQRTYDMQIHSYFEVVICSYGSVELNIKNQQITIKEGEGVFIAPYTLRSYTITEGSLAYIFIFSPSFIPDFAKRLENQEYVNYVFTMRKTILNSIFTLAKGNTLSADGSIIMPKPDEFTLKAFLYSMISSFTEDNTLVDKKTESIIIKEILQYIEQNFTLDISLQSLSQAIDYDYEYLSRVFNKIFGQNFSSLVNQYRCNKAQQLIATTNQTLAQIATNSGFQSVRTFNRVFKSIVGKSPSKI